MKRLLVLSLLLCVCLCAQVADIPGTTPANSAFGIVNTNFSYIADRLVEHGTTLPATCPAPYVYLKTDAPAGQNLYYCTAANTWTVQSTGLLQIKLADTPIGSPRAALNLQPGSYMVAVPVDDGTEVDIPFDIDPAKVATRANVQSGASVFCNDASGSNANYTCALSPALAAYTTGMVIPFRPQTTSTAGALTLTIGGLASVNLKQANGSTDPGAGALVAGQGYLLFFDGSAFRVLAGLPSGGGGSGDVVGPASAVSGNLPTFDGTTGKLIKDSGLKVVGATGLYSITTDQATGASQLDLNPIANDGDPATVRIGRETDTSDGVRLQVLRGDDPGAPLTNHELRGVGDSRLAANNGNVGVGVGTIARKLDVFGSGRFSGLLEADGGLLPPHSTTLPGTCAVGQVYVKTDATATQQQYVCTATNTWTQQGGGSSYDPLDRTWWYAVDEFIGGSGNGANSGIGELGWSIRGPGGGISYENTDNPPLGWLGPIRDLRTGSTATNTSYLTLSTTGNSVEPFAIAQFLNYSGWVLDFDLKTFSSIDSRYIGWGIYADQVITDALVAGTDQRITVERDTAQGDSNWMCTSRGPSGVTRVDTGVAVATSTKYRVTITGNAANSFTCSIDGGTPSTPITTNLPTIPAYIALVVQTHAAAEARIEFGRFAAKIRRE